MYYLYVRVYRYICAPADPTHLFDSSVLSPLSPSPEAIFSGDAHGRIRVWDSASVQHGSRAVLCAGADADATGWWGMYLANRLYPLGMTNSLLWKITIIHGKIHDFNGDFP